MIKCKYFYKRKQGEKKYTHFGCKIEMGVSYCIFSLQYFKQYENTGKKNVCFH